MQSSLSFVILMLGAAVLGVVVFRILQLPPILGYLTVGIIIGPHSTRLVSDAESLSGLAEYGVVFLMFSIGLEFSLPQLYAMRRLVFGLGLSQVVTTIAVTMAICLGCTYLFSAIDISWHAALALGGAIAMSSTAIVSKMLAEKLELESEHGRRIIGILLFQDLAVVVLLILVPTLANNPGNIWMVIGLALGKAILVMATILFFGQKLMSKWLSLVARRKSQELFMLNLLLITLGAAWITEHFGLSLELGAFMAGMLISETRYKHEVEADIKSFRDVLLGLYFITIGMLLNVRLVIAHWWAILLLIIALFVVKFVLIAWLTKMFGASRGVSIRTGLALAQVGEFGFVLLNQVGGLNMLEPWLVQVLLASMVLSMLTAPFIIAPSDRVVMKFSANEWMLQSLALTQLASSTMGTKQHVVIAGFGRTGQSVARLLSDEKIAYHALDLDLERVRRAEAAGEHVSYADATRRESLIAAGIHRASSLVITFANTHAALTIMHYAKELAPSLPVIVRSHDDTDFERLKEGGADEIVPEAIESSLVLTSHALLAAGIPIRRVMRRTQEARMERYVSLREYFHGESDASLVDEDTYRRLHSLRIPPESHAVGQTLRDLGLPSSNVEVTMVRRGKEKLETYADMKIEADDVLVLRGTSEGITLTEERLLK
ncbi:cation:proton antiporter [Oxalobacter vibrioformis]|uniref:Cation:proton antiporter n=1 Tax=Oxalobacter vibrioformis TaxID=933080 RepID=A0A9E9M0D2_9BURK|nr:monovalent cation:proton antiporter family protein [Oxalobacter vibrioformis]WAW10852.1 cation:proton antiporter [Oxalobacter vibrioformis]